MGYNICVIPFRILLFVILLAIASCYSKTVEEPNCSMKETCSDCIREFGCVWCINYDKFHDSEKQNLVRCITENEMKSKPNLCKNMVNPKQKATIVKNIKTSSEHPENVVQLSPQKVSISLRKGEEYNLDFKYVQANDYPVDLYYIIDNSYSMAQFKAKLSSLGDKLANTMKRLTKHFRLGFGSFVEKTRLPFVDERPHKLKNPCKDYCSAPYVFKNHLSLTNDTKRFGQELSSIMYSTNLDDPEADLDALMQAIVCKEEIGWRENARHLLVVSTDSEYHIAGDGKLAGLVIPHDGECHMENHMYTYGSVFDYPSIAQINAKAMEHNINMIFVIAYNSVTPKAEEYYRMLKDFVKDADLGILLDDNSNVIDLIKNYYNKIRDSIKITDNSGGNIEVKYYSPCTSNKTTKTNQCDNLHVGVQVNFTAVIKLIDCPKSGNRKQTFHIKPGNLNESLTVEVEFLCDCDCDKRGHIDYKERAKECSGSGTFKCGVCDCDHGKLGSKCECDGKNLTLVKETNNCRQGESSEICSGHGNCKCNKCVCNRRNGQNEKIYGKYCQCNNFSCKRNKNRVCSGERRGVCDCGKCFCFAGFAGDACECPDNNSICIKPSDKKECSGRGECICGECQCKYDGDYTYSGQYCDECPTCPGSRCNDLQHCVQCRLHKTGMYNQNDCLRYCTKYNIEAVGKIDRDHLESNEKFCELYDYSEKCYFRFKYSYGTFNNVINIVAQKGKECPRVNILGVVLFSIGSILIGGIIILLIWKGVTTVHDRREYAKFQSDAKNSKWNKSENPLFQKASTDFTNPMFASIVDDDN